MGQAGSILGIGVTIAIGITGILASVDHPDPHWLWPTNLMAIPAAIMLTGLFLFVVPVPRVSPPPEPPAPPDPSGGYHLSLVDAELDRWQQFAVAAAAQGWIKFTDEVPPADALGADDGSARQVVPEPTKANLLKAYRYFAAVVAAHEGIENWRKSQATSTTPAQKRDNGGISDAVASTVSTVIVTVGLHGIRYAWLTARLKRAQEKNHDYQARLQALPDILTALKKDIAAVAAGTPAISTAPATLVEVPDVPVIETGKDGSIDFRLTPIKDYSLAS